VSAVAAMASPPGRSRRRSESRAPARRGPIGPDSVRLDGLDSIGPDRGADRTVGTGEAEDTTQAEDPAEWVRVREEERERKTTGVVSSEG